MSMSTPATHDDVNLILRLYEMRREDRMREARTWFRMHFRPKTVEELNTLCPPGSKENDFFRQVVSYWEMVASFINAGVLGQDLFFETGQELLLAYVRVKPVLGPAREVFKNPKLFANLEGVGEQFIAWWEQRAPGAHAAFVARMG